MKRLIVCAMICIAVFGTVEAASKPKGKAKAPAAASTPAAAKTPEQESASVSVKPKPQEIRWAYTAFLSAQDVDFVDVYTAVRQVFINQNLPGFGVRLTDRHIIESEWLGISREAPYPAKKPTDSPVTVSSGTEFPAYIKFFVIIDKTGYTLNALSNTGGARWVPYGRSYPSAGTRDVLPWDEQWDLVISLARAINMTLKSWIDGDQYAESFLRGETTPPLYSGATYPEDIPSWAYPDMPPNFNRLTPIYSGNILAPPPQAGNRTPAQLPRHGRPLGQW
jgi:hypothetical protein